MAWVGSSGTDPYRALVEAIVWQQLSIKAAATIYQRLLGLFSADGGLTPRAVGAMRRDRLRKAGLSWAKVDYLKDLSARSIGARWISPPWRARPTTT